MASSLAQKIGEKSRTERNFAFFLDDIRSSIHYRLVILVLRDDDLIASLVLGVEEPAAIVERAQPLAMASRRSVTYTNEGRRMRSVYFVESAKHEFYSADDHPPKSCDESAREAFPRQRDCRP
jgi:hypothetical protein